MDERLLTMDQLEDFLRQLRREERARGTVEKYRRDLSAFAAWLEGRAVTAEAAAAWKERLLSSGLSPVTVNSKLSALNSLLKFLGWENCRVKFLRLQRRVFRERDRELTREEYGRLLAAARETGRERLELLLETICATGIRVSELRYITVEAARSGRADVALKGKIRTVLLPGKLCRKLLKYAKRQKTASGEIFVTKSGRSLCRRQIWQEMKNLCKRAGVAPSKVFPHNLRHLFATVFYRACRDIVRLADVLGHSSVNTTRIYLQTTGAEHVRQLDRLRLVT
jgi:site-specific recombinase XerD